MRHKGTIQPDGLVVVGPLVNVQLTPNKRFVPPGHVAPRTAITMMIDTGAQSTVIDDRIAVSMGLTPTRQQSMVGVSGKPELCPVYPVCIHIAFADADGNIAHAEFACDAIGMSQPPAGTRHQGLIGRDFLKHFELHYDGPNGRFDIIVPAAQRAKLLPPKPLVPAALTPAQREERKAKRKAAEKAQRKNRK